MTFYNNPKTERAESYRILSEFFLGPPDDEALSVMKEDFELASQETSEQIHEDFAALFVYPGGILPPFESHFAFHAKGMTIDDVAVFYINAGLTIDEEYGLLPDHLATEFLFMSYLVGTNQNSLQKKFLEQHVMNWVPYYCEEIIRQANTEFYREIAGIIRDFLISEYEALIE